MTAIDVPARHLARSTADVRLDACGVAHRRAPADARIVSLVPSVTELLCDLDLERQLVGRTGFCIHPRDTVKKIPKVGGTKDVDIAKLRALAPTHLIVNIDENRREIVDEVADFIEHVFVTHPLGPADNRKLYDDLGFVFSRDERAAALCSEFDQALERLACITDKPQRRVLYLIWRDPWMSVAPDTYISRMLQLINWHTLPEDPPVRYPEIALAEIADRIDRVLLSSEPYPFRDKHVAELSEFFGPQVAVSLVDGEMLSWYGSRAIRGIDYLADLATGRA